MVNENGWTALHWATIKGFIENVKALIGARADVNMVDETRMEPLQ